MVFPFFMGGVLSQGFPPSTTRLGRLLAEGATFNRWNAEVRPLKDALQEPCTLTPGFKARGAAIFRPK